QSKLLVSMPETTAKEELERQIRSGNSRIDFQKIVAISSETSQPVDHELVPLESEQAAKCVRELFLRDLRIDDKALEHVSKVPLRELDLRGNSVRDLHAIKDMKSLQILNLEHLSSSLVPGGFAVIANLKALERLVLANNPQVNDRDLHYLLG